MVGVSRNRGDYERMIGLNNIAYTHLELLYWALRG